MKLKNVKVGMKVVVKKQDHYCLSKGDIVEVIDVYYELTARDYLNVLVTDDHGTSYWLKHKDVKKLKEV